jgi:hypothetical protein
LLDLRIGELHVGFPPIGFVLSLRPGVAFAEQTAHQHTTNRPFASIQDPLLTVSPGLELYCRQLLKNGADFMAGSGTSTGELA